MDDVLTAARSVLELTPARWRAIAGGLPADLVQRSPAAGEWSALHCLQHLVDTEREVFPARIRAFLEGRDFAAFDPDAEGTVDSAGQTPESLAQQLEASRRETLALLDGVTGDDLTRVARHAELGLVTFSELIHEWAAHDLMHTVQAERALMQPFIEGCGPWRSYFADHAVRSAGQA